MEKINNFILEKLKIIPDDLKKFNPKINYKKLYEKLEKIKLNFIIKNEDY